MLGSPSSVRPLLMPSTPRSVCCLLSVCHSMWTAPFPVHVGEAISSLMIANYFPLWGLLAHILLYVPQERLLLLFVGWLVAGDLIHNGFTCLPLEHLYAGTDPVTQLFADECMHVCTHCTGHDPAVASGSFRCNGLLL